MLIPESKKIQFPHSIDFLYMIHVSSPNGRRYGLYLYPEKTIFNISDSKDRCLKEYGGEREDDIAIIQTVPMPKEVRKCYLDVMYNWGESLKKYAISLEEEIMARRHKR